MKEIGVTDSNEEKIDSELASLCSPPLTEDTTQASQGYGSVKVTDFTWKEEMTHNQVLSFLR